METNIGVTPLHFLHFLLLAVESVENVHSFTPSNIVCVRCVEQNRPYMHLHLMVSYRYMTIHNKTDKAHILALVSL